MSNKLINTFIVLAIIPIVIIIALDACGVIPNEPIVSTEEAEARLKVLEAEREVVYEDITHDTCTVWGGDISTDVLGNVSNDDNYCTSVNSGMEEETINVPVDYYSEPVAVADLPEELGTDDSVCVADTAPSEDVYSLAWEYYGLTEYDVTGCLKIISYEGYGDFGEWTLSYYCACACISCALSGDVYREFGRADGFYTADGFVNIGIKDWAYDSLREALNNYVYVYEINGVRYDFENAIYDSWCNGYHFGVWQN